MDKILIFGHKSPDTDTITSSLVMEKYLKNKNIDAKAVRLGNINKETKYVLNYLKIEEPELIDTLEDGQNVVLVDHNEFAQSANNIENAKIMQVVDHHRIYGFETSEPVNYRAEAVGCTETILYKMFKEANMDIEKKEAILMLSGIISDSLLFKSPTCTKEDIDVANELAKISDIDVNTYGLEMLKAGTDLSDLSAEELVKLDAKEVMLGNVKAVIDQVNTISIEDMLKRKEELENEIIKTINEKSLDVFVLLITDILNSNSQVITLGKKSDLVEKSYNVELVDNTAFLPGIVSRKKQVIPVMTQNTK